MFAPTAKDAPLYGQQKRSTASNKEAASTSSLAFTSQLSSLLSSTNSSTSQKQPRGRMGKDDIFSTHRQKKAAKSHSSASITSDLTQKHSTQSDAVDDSAWHRSRRKMEDKARLYAAMKRGDVDDEHGKHMVDFDRKWAEKHDSHDHESSGGSDDGADSGPEEMVEWTDEFGRTRTGTRAQQAREQRAHLIRAENDTRARPAAPAKLIHGDIVQDEAFNPDTAIVDKMAQIAAKRDRSLTPPPETYFDGSKEIRSKGVGFMQFSLDETQRREQMDLLEKERSETLRLRMERARRLQERKDEVDRRRKEIQEKRGKRKADTFLVDLGAELDAKRRDADEAG